MIACTVCARAGTEQEHGALGTGEHLPGSPDREDQELSGKASRRR